MQVSYSSLRYTFFWWGTALLRYIPALFILHCHQFLAFFSLLLVIFRKTSRSNSSYSVITLKTHLWWYCGVIFFPKCAKIVDFFVCFSYSEFVILYTHLAYCLSAPSILFWGLQYLLNILVTIGQNILNLQCFNLIFIETL